MSASKQYLTNFKTTQAALALKEKYPAEHKSLIKLFSYINSHCEGVKDGYWANIHWKALRNFDAEYKTSKDILIKEGLIDLNPSVSYGPLARNPHTQSYRIPKNKFDGGLFWYSFAERKRKVRQCAPVQDKTTAIGSGVEWQKEIFGKLTVDSENFVTTGKPKWDAKILASFKKIKSGIFNASTGRTVGRLFNTISLMKREGRKYIRFEGRPMVDSDIKTCHAFLILAICAPKDRELYGCLVSNGDFDLYNTVAQWAGSGLDRDALKKQFLCFLNGGMRLKNNIFSNWFKTNFPATWQRIIDGGKGNAVFFQNLEAEIMRKLGKFCAEKKYVYLQIHDGFLSTEEHYKLIANHLISIIYNRFGYKPIIKSEVLTNKPLIKEEQESNISSYSNGVAFENQSNNNIIPISSLNSNTNGLKFTNFAPPKKKIPPRPRQAAENGVESRKKCVRVLPEWLKQKISRERRAKFADSTYLEKVRRENVFEAKDSIIDNECLTL